MRCHFCGLANACKDQSKTAEKNGALAARYQQQCISHALRNEILWFQLARPPNTKLAATTWTCAEMESMNRFTFTFQLSPQYKHYGYERLNTIAFVKRMKHPLATQITSASFQLYNSDSCLCNVDRCWNCLKVQRCSKFKAWEAKPLTESDHSTRVVASSTMWPCDATGQCQETEMPRPMPESRREISKNLMPPASAPKRPPKMKNASWADRESAMECLEMFRGSTQAPITYVTLKRVPTTRHHTTSGLSRTEFWRPASEITNCIREPWLGR